MNRDAMMRHLVELVGPDGAVPSWVNARHPGYAYPEAAAIVLRLLAQEPDPPRALIDRLVRFVSSRPAGKDGRVYTFDRGLVLAALISAGVRVQPDDIAQRIERRIAVEPGAPARWSTVVGPHFLKLAVVESLRGAVAPLRPTLAEGGRIPTPAHGSTYVHAHCYAVEGLLALGELDDARRAATWLAEIQSRDGGLPSTHDGRRGESPHPADATAQAIRLWCCLDRTHFRPAIDRALAFLERLAADGGVRYSDASDDVNTWATAFAIQALDFAHGDASAQRIV